MKLLEDKGFIDQSEWQRVLLEQMSADHKASDAEGAPATSPSSAKPRDTARRVMPWLLSIVLHVVVVLLALLWVWRKQPPQQRQPVIPIAQLSAMVGGPMIAPEHDLAEVLPMPDIETLMQPTFDDLPGLDHAPGQDTASLLMPPTDATAQTPPPSTAMPPARVNPFTGLMPHALQPVAAFFGVAGNAQSVVYVVDASGSLIDTLPYVITELRQSIMRLSEQQQFTVLFFQGNDVLEAPPTGLRQATAINQQRAAQWVGSLFAKGRSNPLPALQKALGYEPDLLFLLTDNLAAQQTGTQSDDALLAQITKANIAHSAIHTIQFLYQDTSADAADREPLLKRLAQQQGGQYTFVDAKDLKPQ
jgi:hypothetical protein